MGDSNDYRKFKWNGLYYNYMLINYCNEFVAEIKSLKFVEVCE